jgi:cytochrome c oxidase assembly factor CtaG
MRRVHFCPSSELSLSAAPTFHMFAHLSSFKSAFVLQWKIMGKVEMKNTEKPP